MSARRCRNPRLSARELADMIARGLIRDVLAMIGDASPSEIKASLLSLRSPELRVLTDGDYEVLAHALNLELE